MNFLAGLLPDFDAKVLMNNKQELTSEELLGLLRQIDSPGIDTSKSVFEALDRKGNGEVDLQFLSNLMEKFGIETFGEKDFEFLLECMDEDGDGVVGLADFRNFLGRENK
jgi:Ca2+-binding EF-hand superfamily protein